MSSREEWCADKLSKLLNEDLRISTLNEIKEHFTTVPQEEATRTAEILPLPLVFDCLNDSNNEQVDLACEVLTLCMNNLTIGESTARYGVPLERALLHPSPSVKLMALKDIQRNMAKEEVLLDLSQRTGLLNNILLCLGDDDVSVGKKASDIMQDLGFAGIEKITSSLLDTLNEVMMKNEVVRLRFYELFVNVAKDSEATFQLLNSCGIIEQILSELDSNDILLRMNIIEILTQLGLCPHGYIYLEANGILSKMFAVFENGQDNLSMQLCEPGILKFFGHIAQWRPLEVMSKYPKFYDRLFSNLESSDLTIVGISLDTLGFIAFTNEGKIALDSTGNKMTYAVKVITKLLPSLPNEVRIRALNCLENLVAISEYRPEACNIARRWFELFGDVPIEFVLKYAKNPFAEIRIAGLGILMRIARHVWGQLEIRNTPGLIEFLLDRSIETDKGCKEIKYEIVKLLSGSDMFDEATVRRLQAFVKEGPFYVEAVTEVAIEGND